MHFKLYSLHVRAVMEMKMVALRGVRRVVDRVRLRT